MYEHVCISLIFLHIPSWFPTRIWQTLTLSPQFTRQIRIKNSQTTLFAVQTTSAVILNQIHTNPCIQKLCLFYMPKPSSNNLSSSLHKRVLTRYRLLEKLHIIDSQTSIFHFIYFIVRIPMTSLEIFPAEIILKSICFGHLFSLFNPAPNYVFKTKILSSRKKDYESSVQGGLGTQSNESKKIKD